MKKLVHIFNSLEYSGAERMIFSLNEFYNSNFETYVVSTGVLKGEFYEEYSTKYTCFHKPVTTSRNVNYIKNLIQYIRFYRSNKVDIVHIHPAARFTFHIIAAKLGGVKKIVRQVHNNFEFYGVVRMKESFVRKMARALNVEIISISPSVYKNELLRFNNKTKQINNFYDEEKIYPKKGEEKNKLRLKHGVLEDSFVIISVGACCDRKQHKHIIDSVTRLKNKVPNILYLHLGEGEDTADEKKMCLKNNISENVVFVGNTENVRDFLIMSDVYVMTSKVEGLSIATIEAMGASIPCVLYNTTGSSDLGVNGAPGILIEPNSDALEQEIFRLYKLGNPYISDLGEKSLKYAVEHYSKKEAINKWKNLYFDK